MNKRKAGREALDRRKSNARILACMCQRRDWSTMKKLRVEVIKTSMLLTFIPLLVGYILISCHLHDGQFDDPFMILLQRRNDKNVFGALHVDGVEHNCSIVEPSIIRRLSTTQIELCH